jgi:hypothetical protein
MATIALLIRWLFMDYLLRAEVRPKLLHVEPDEHTRLNAFSD